MDIPEKRTTENKNNFVSVKFKVVCETIYGESLYLVGSIPQLKNWNIDDAILMQPDNYSPEHPTWESPEILIPLNTSVEYKFFKKGNGNTFWEKLPFETNHSIILTFGENADILQTFGITYKQIEVKSNGLSHRYSEDIKETQKEEKVSTTPIGRKFTVVFSNT